MTNKYIIMALLTENFKSERIIKYTDSIIATTTLQKNKTNAVFKIVTIS